MDFIQAFPARNGLPLEPLLAPAFTTSWLRDAHARRDTLGRVHPLGVYTVTDASVTGYGHVFANGQRLSRPDLVPAYIEARIESGAIDPMAGLSLPARVIDEPVIAFMGYGQRIWGHALIEMAPKVGIAIKLLGDLSFLLPDDVPDWFRSLMRRAGARRFIEYSPTSEHLICRSAYVVTLPWDKAIHPDALPTFTAIRGDVRPFSGPALFVARGAASTVWNRPLLNADAIEAAAKELGFRIVQPEVLALEDQIRLFASAPVIVGAYGSGLHNAVFCQPGTIVGSITALDRLQSAISALSKTRQSYLDHLDGDPLASSGYSVSTERFSAWAKSLLASSRGEPCCALT